VECSACFNHSILCIDYRHHYFGIFVSYFWLEDYGSLAELNLCQQKGKTSELKSSLNARAVTAGSAKITRIRGGNIKAAVVPA
jgi:hypothetical protein